ncbi:Eukaryotic initiation factor 4A-III [Mortierella claussenii]|nr:Eukaryotic initiation factor 4A-III [Mortierella claussenii]
MSHPTLAELSLSLSHVQSLLKQITAEVKVLSEGIAVLVEQEEAEDVEEELNYLDVDPWSNVKNGKDDKDSKNNNGNKSNNSNDSTDNSAGRRDSIRSLLQRKPSTVKDETKALARILSQKRTSGGAEETATTSGDKQKQGLRNGSTNSSNGGGGSSSLSSSNLQDQVIEEDYISSEGSLSFHGNGNHGAGEKQELSELTVATLNSPTSVTSGNTSPQPSALIEAERVPHTITVQTTPMPTKFSIAITKPTSTPQSPSPPVLSTSSSSSSLRGGLTAHHRSSSSFGNNSNNSSTYNTININSINNINVGNSSTSSNGNHTNGSSTSGGHQQPPFWRSSTVPNMSGSLKGMSISNGNGNGNGSGSTHGSEVGSRPNSMIGNSVFDSGYYSMRGSAQSRRSLQPEPRNSSDHQAIGHGSIKDRYTALRTSSQGAGLHHTLNSKDSAKSFFTVNSPKPLVASQVEKMESTDCFSKLGLLPELLRGIYAYGLKMPSILQQRGIPMIMTRHDVLTQAKPEVAKTLTYAIPLLNFLTLPATSIHPQLLILCSNHDLCLHVQRVLLALARFMPTISCLICAEGNNATLSLGTLSTTQVNTSGKTTSKSGYGSSQNGFVAGAGAGTGGGRGGSTQVTDSTQVIAAHVVIGTPGKVLNLVRTKQISLTALKVMVLENADILLASPLKEATISLLSMVRDVSSNTNGITTVSAAAPTSSATAAEPLSSPPNSGGSTSPVSAAVAALNGRALGSSSGSLSSSSSGPSSVGSNSRLSGIFEVDTSRPRSTSSTTGSLTSSSAATSSTSTAASSVTTSSSTTTITAATASTATATNQPQLLFFSTEVPSHVLDYVAQYMTQPTKALVKGHELALKGILQFFKYMTIDDEDWQLELLCETLEDSGANRAVVFCNKNESVERVVRKIRERKGFAIGVYSDMDLSVRKAAINRFRGSAPPVYLITTDDATKELDILTVPLVVSFEIPSVGNYIPRVKWIDRSKGKVGAKVTFVDGHRGEGQILRSIQQHYRTTIDDMPASISEFIVN